MIRQFLYSNYVVQDDEMFNRHNFPGLGGLAFPYYVFRSF
jgi:hypothetical protein